MSNEKNVCPLIYMFICWSILTLCLIYRFLLNCETYIHIHMCKLFPHALHSFILYSICCYLPSDFIETFYTLRFILEACGKLQATTTKWLTAFWKRCTFFMQRSIYIEHTYTYNLETFYGIFSHSVSFMLLLLHLLNTLGGSLFAKFFEYMYIYIFF